MRIRPICLTGLYRRKQVARSLATGHSELPFSPFLFEFSGLNDRDKHIISQLENGSDVRVLREGSGDLIISFGSPAAVSVLEQLVNPGDVEWEIVAGQLHRFFNPRKPVWQWNTRRLDFSEGPFIMGILNVTPDSFSDGGRYLEAGKAVEHALAMVEEGATIIDIGGESSRPGAEPVPASEEERRIVPVIEKVRAHSDVLISVDTYKAPVARSALQAGCDMVNDISAATFDPEMARVVLQSAVPLIIMHMKGTPRDMQNNPHYHDVVAEIYRYFEKRTGELVRDGLQMLMLDPGIGFGKRLSDNLRLIRDLNDFRFLGYPILMGTSRKSFIGKISGGETDERLYGTLATVQASLHNGADVVRVHDVKAVKEVINIINAVENPDDAE